MNSATRLNVKALLHLFSPYQLSTSVIKRNLAVGDKTSLRRIVTADDVRQFSEISGDFNPIHEGEQPLVHGALLNAYVSASIATKLPGPGTVLVKEYLKFPNPCHAVDSLVVTVEITEVRKLVSCKFNVFSEKTNKVVLEGDAKLLVDTS